MKTRYICITGSQRAVALYSKYGFSKTAVKKGDHLFKLDELSQQELSLLKDLDAKLNTFFKILASDFKSIVLKIIPEQELLEALGSYKNQNKNIDDFIIKVINYFSPLPRPPLWKLKNRNLDFTKTPLIMGILNATPDSFSDGGLYNNQDKALEHALRMIKEGADIIDIGGESSRPGAQPVSEDQEIARTIPLIAQIRKHSSVIISIDTCKSHVAQQALEAGADIINDISATESDPQMKAIIKKYNCPVVIMHKQGTPQNMQTNPLYNDVQEEVYHYLAKKCLEIEPLNGGKIIIDPGIGFGKTTNHNLSLLRDVQDLTFIGKPVLLGLSRKSFIGKSLAVETDNRLIGSLISEFYSVLNGVGILRVHDVKETVQARKLMANILAA